MELKGKGESEFFKNRRFYLTPGLDTTVPLAFCCSVYEFRYAVSPYVPPVPLTFFLKLRELTAPF